MHGDRRASCPSLCIALLPFPRNIREPSGVCRGSEQHSMRNQVARQRMFGQVFDMTQAAEKDARKGVITTIDTRCVRMSALRGAWGRDRVQRHTVGFFEWLGAAWRAGSSSQGCQVDGQSFARSPAHEMRIDGVGKWPGGLV